MADTAAALAGDGANVYHFPRLRHPSRGVH